ncbi:vacuolar protein sorting-associated protein 11 homolog [Patella vulgata]|uniref:vacuolar protein sorting-associated protein 11 homolog n=1 Tax=Patella vulgata TaxID=6465 RepID=UPI0021807145|nr:vacuolar protein sorting-associated protein 11 homolog [Patella vulgata]
MAFLQWRRFNFFEKEIVKDPETEQAFEQLKDVNVSACASGRGQLIIGDFEGHMYFINRQLQLTAFKAYEIRVSHLYQMKQHNILLSVGEDEQGINPLIKVWNLDKMERGNPLCTRITRAIPGNKPTPVTCLAVHDNLNYMAVGFETGSVVLFKGDVTRERHSKSRIVFENSKRVTGLMFRSSGKDIFLFVVTENETVSINISGRDQKIVLEKMGAKLSCTVMSDANQDNQVVIGRQDAVYFYQPDERGPCLAFEGEKLQLHWFRGYLVIVGKENKLQSRAPILGSGKEMNLVTVYDIQNKFIAYSAPYQEVIDVMCEWGSLYILAGDRKLYQLQEKDTQTKLDMLFKKNNYTLAISLAKSQQYDEDGLIDIFTQYGDHLYGKGDHDGAIDQYIKTIGKLEASYVIRKFLDAQRIHNLTKYLQALHKAQLATEEHTTLLLNCYTKLKDVSKLDEFIMTKDREIDFDVETAIKVCRQAGYHKHALSLAEKHKKHEWYLKIQLEDIKEYHKGLEYIGKLEFDECEDNLRKYGKILMTQVPEQTTSLLKILCTDYKPVDRPLVDASNLEGGRSQIMKAKAEDFIHIFVNNSTKLTEFLEHMITVQPNSSELVYDTLLELYLHDMVHRTDQSARTMREKKTLELLKNPDSLYNIDQALILCQMNNFKAGILYLYEKAHLYQQILRYHMEQNEYTLVIQACEKFGAQDPNLWVQALSYFARKEECCKAQLIEVLSQIDRRNLLPPLLVIQTLAHNSTATLSVVKDYIIRRLQHENDQITEDERLIKQYRDDTDKKRVQIEELKTSAKIFQASKCNICNHPLELPSVHFLCEPHSYHQHCFESYAENDNECPVCAPENRKIMDIIRAQEQTKDIHESFHNQLERAPDGFSIVADYFGRGVFNKVTLITDSPSKLQGSSVSRMS